MTKLIAITKLKADGAKYLDQYMAAVGPLIEGSGARLLNRYEVQKVIAGEAKPQFITIMEYPNEAAIKAVFESEEYLSLGEIKNRAFETYQVLLVD